MKHFLLVVALSSLIFVTNALRAADGFEAVHCGSDVAKALLGRTMTNERIVTLEDRHKDLGLKDLGGSEISEGFTMTSWLICADEYVILEERNVVRDVLKFPKHSKEMPEFVGPCQSNGHDTGEAIGVLKNEYGVQMLSVTAAWKVDQKRKKFVKLATEGLRCSRDNIVTADGGR
jgi:hypothetical protein